MPLQSRTYSSDKLFQVFSYQSGFNLGYGRGWYDLGLSEDRVSGRHLYLIHSERPVKGGCDVNRNPDKGSSVITKCNNWSHSNRNTKCVCSYLQFYFILIGKAHISPSVIDMFGGNILEVSGPCFYESDTIELLFGNISLTYGKGECYRISDIKAKCEVPPLTARGRIAITVSLNGGISTSYIGSITVGKVVQNHIEYCLEFLMNCCLEIINFV